FTIRTPGAENVGAPQTVCDWNRASEVAIPDQKLRPAKGGDAIAIPGHAWITVVAHSGREDLGLHGRFTDTNRKKLVLLSRGEIARFVVGGPARPMPEPQFLRCTAAG